MKKKTLALAIAATFLVAGLTETATAQTRRSSGDRSSARDRSNDRSRQGATRGSVRYYRDRDQSGGRGNRGDRGAQDRNRNDRSRVDRGRRADDRSTTRIRRSTTTMAQHPSSSRRRAYYPTDVRNRASYGSVHNHRNAVQLPSYPDYRDHYGARVRTYPRYGIHVTQLPSHHVVYTHHGHDYYRCDGIYYRRYGDYYRVVRPPIGVSLTYLPAGYVTVEFGGRPYYRYENTYYVQQVIDSQPTYVVVEPPSQVYVDTLPPDCYQVYYRDRLYYVDIYEEIAYAPVIVDGYTRYRPTNLDVDVDIDDGQIEIEIDD
ncbi:MAG: DUF6515 family protein [Phycisphaerae bacterium]|nr:hypothetical protein [Phycisphaerales bacterium]